MNGVHSNLVVSLYLVAPCVCAVVFDTLGKRMLYEAFFISFWRSLSMKSNLPSFVSNALKSSLNSGFMINMEVVCINEVFSCTPQSFNIFMACAMVETRLACGG
jgi:hypothetical protein